MQPISSDEFNSHVKRLLEAFEVLNKDLNDLRKQASSMSCTEPEIVAKGKESARYIHEFIYRNPSGTQDRWDSHKPALLRGEQLETDFTTQGKESSLGCPFASMNSEYQLVNHFLKAPANLQQSQSRPTPSTKSKRHVRNISDPITAELHSGSLTSAPPSISTSASKCPIRYLDQHSPEELAQYFESHKHELPRSHEVCVKRFQRNKESIRQLDAKYGDLVSMIQGLGIRHKPLLPVKDDDEDGDAEMERGRRDGRLEQWAEGVSETYKESDEGVAVGEEDKSERGRAHEVNSDRPLKEIRVGESPSRPWGIPIPPLVEPVRITNSSEHAEPIHLGSATITKTDLASANTLPSQEASTKRKACSICNPQRLPANPDPPQLQNPTPRNNDSAGPTSPSATSNPQFKHNAEFTTPSTTAVAGSRRPQTVFTGPVFVGFSVEEARAVLGGWNGGEGSLRE